MASEPHFLCVLSVLCGEKSGKTNYSFGGKSNVTFPVSKA